MTPGPPREPGRVLPGRRTLPLRGLGAAGPSASRSTCCRRPSALCRWRPTPDGYHAATVDERQPRQPLPATGSTGRVERPDPASRSQPDGVHGPPRSWTRASPGRTPSWRGLPLEDFVIYELHVGTFTPEGTFDAVIPHLDAAAPSSASPPSSSCRWPSSRATRNWGYDGVYPVRRPELLRRARRPAGAWSTPATAAASPSCSTSSTTTSGPEGNYLGRVRALLHRPLPHALGAGAQLRRPRQRRGAPLLHRERLYWIDGVPHRRAAARRGPRHPRPLGAPVPRGAGRGRRRAGARESAGAST